jgi:hypothetical protein
MSTNQDDRRVTATEDPELRALFAPRRPDAERFRSGVAERLRRADAGGGGGGATAQPARATWRERAASMLPALPPGTSLGSNWAAWLSLPALLFVGCLAAFWRGDRSLVRALQSARSTMPRRQPSGVQGTFWQRHSMWLRAGLLGLVVAGLGFLLGPEAMEDVLLVVLLGSMLVLAGQVGALAAHHGAPTEAVGACAVDLLLAAIFGLGFAGMFGDSVLSVAIDSAGLVLAAGAMVVEVLRRWRTREFKIAMCWGVVVAAFACACISRWFAPAGSAALRLELAQADPARGDEQHWRALELCGEALRAAGEAAPDLSSLRGHLANVIASQPQSWPTTWSAGARLGLITPQQWQQLERTEYVAYHLRNILVDRGSLALFSHDRYLLDALLATTDIGDGERAHLVARIERSWPAVDAPNPGVDLGKALLCVQWLDRLGRPDLVTARVPLLRELLRVHWVAPGAANGAMGTGGFASQPGARAWLPETIDALELMVRVGPPPEIDVGALRAFLQRHVGGAPLARLDGSGKQAFAGLVLLDAGLHLPPRGVAQWLLDERLIVGSLLLVVLALRAVWHTRPLSVRGRGALP